MSIRLGHNYLEMGYGQISWTDFDEFGFGGIFGGELGGKSGGDYLGMIWRLGRRSLVSGWVDDERIFEVATLVLIGIGKVCNFTVYSIMTNCPGCLKISRNKRIISMKVGTNIHIGLTQYLKNEMQTTFIKSLLLYVSSAKTL